LNNSGIANNTIHSNKGYGMILRSGSSNLICDNTFILNSRGNALDDGEDNIWDCGPDRGNIWDDWNETGFYYIEGEANSVDRYPSLIDIPITTSNATIPENSLLFQRLLLATVVVILGIFAMTFWLQKRKSSISMS
jgi:parallel beta-helix repeat protein